MRGVSILALALVACHEEPPTLSSDVATADMTLLVRAEGDVRATRLSVYLGGPGGSVQLVGDDALIARTAFEERRLRLGGREYVVDLAPAVPSVALQLLREPPHDGAHVAVAMPPASTIEAPASASRSEPLELRWEPAAGPHTTSLAVEGDCFTFLTRTLTVDEGHYTIQPADLAPSSESCPITVTLTRYQDVLLAADPLAHAQAQLWQVSATTLESLP